MRLSAFSFQDLLTKKKKLTIGQLYQNALQRSTESPDTDRLFDHRNLYHLDIIYTPIKIANLHGEQIYFSFQAIETLINVIKTPINTIETLMYVLLHPLNMLEEYCTGDT